MIITLRRHCACTKIPPGGVRVTNPECRICDGTGERIIEFGSVIAYTVEQETP